MAGKIIGGDFKDGTLVFDDLRLGNGVMGFASESVKGNVESVEIVTEANKKKFMGAAGWGLVGMAALGPLGLGAGLVGGAAGALAGGNKKEICFACYLNDGRKFLAVVDAGLYQKFVAESMKSSAHPPTLDNRLDVMNEKMARWTNEMNKNTEEWSNKSPAERREANLQAFGGCILYLILFGGLAWLVYYVNTT